MKRLLATGGEWSSVIKQLVQSSWKLRGRVESGLWIGDVVPGHLIYCWPVMNGVGF